jgi:hypothetical protein
MVVYLYPSKLGEEKLQHKPESWQWHKHIQILFGHWVLKENGGSIAVRFCRGLSKIKVQVWVSDSAHIDLRKQPTLQKNVYSEDLYVGWRGVKFATRKGDKIVIRLKVEEFRLSERNDYNYTVLRNIFSLNVTFNGRKLTSADAAEHSIIDIDIDDF